MKIGVTGSRGFIGSNYVAYLKHNHIDYHEIQMNELDASVNLGINHIVHFAAKTSVEQSWDKISEYIDNNVILTSKILDFAREINASISLCSTYGYFPNNDIAPRSPYHLTKALIEQIAYFYYSQFGLPVHLVRIASAFGKGQKQDCLVPKIIKQVLDSDAKKIVVDNLTAQRSYVDVRDVVEFISESIAEIKNFHISYIGSSQLFSVKDLLSLIQHISQTSKEFEEAFPILSDSEDQIFENIKRNMVLGNLINYQLKYSLEDGLKYLIRDF